MIPAKTSGWTKEYYGYLMVEHISRKHCTEFLCIDKDLEPLPGSHQNINAGHFFYVEGYCDSIPCPPYISLIDILQWLSINANIPSHT